MNPLSSLGVGSGGTLNYDIIDKLKKVDENAQIAPIDRKIQDNIAKQTEIVALTTMLNTLNGSVKKITDYSSYLNRNVTSSDESALKVSVAAGVPVQDISVKINEIAKNSVNEVGMKFESRDSIFSNTDTTMNIHLDGIDYRIDILSTDTVGDVAQKIIDNTDGKINASIMKTGIGDSAYSLMINSKETGTQSNIYFGSTLTSKPISADDLVLNDGDFSITLIDENGNVKNIDIILPQTQGGSGAMKLKNAIIEAISKDVTVSSLLSNGDVSVTLSADGKKILLNDIRGHEIAVGGIKSGEIFNDKKVEEGNTFTGRAPVSSGKLNGVLSVGSQNIDLSLLSDNLNSAYDNANAIANAINAIDGYEAKVSNDNKIIINSTTGEVSIKVSKENAQSVAQAGLYAGNFSDWLILQKKLSIKNIQQASDANFSYNGINITRPTNTVDDVVSGVTLDLLSSSDKDINVSITQNSSSIVDEIKAFVESYNALLPKLDELTKYDEDTKIAGIFNSVSDIKSIKGSLHRALSTTRWNDSKNQSIIDYGLSFNDNGFLIFDESKLQSMLVADSKSVIDFFRGSSEMVAGKNIEKKGIFSLLEGELDMLTSGSNAKLKLLEENLTNDDKRLKEERNRSIEMLDRRYEVMANRFAAYDSQIAKANNSFNSLNMLIEQSMADKKK